MRRALFTELAKTYPVYNMGSAKETTMKPYRVLRFDEPVETEVFGRHTTFTVICYANQGDAMELDTVCEDTLKINKKRLQRISDGTWFIPKFIGSGRDFPDDTLKALTKEMRFEVPAFGDEFM